jgi:ADP-heptose:LPS heptosyltransferase
VRIVVFKFNNLGDSVVFVPVLQALRRRFPDWKITLLTTPNEAELYRGPLGPDEIIVCGKRAFDKSYRKPWVLASWIWKVRRRRPDACLVPFDQGTAAHAVAKYSGARMRVGARLDPPRLAGALTEEVPIPGDNRPVTWNRDTARALARLIGPNEGWPETPPPPDLRHLLARGPRPAADRRRVVVHAGASSYLNQWATDRFASVATSLSRDFEVVWISHGRETGSAPPGTVDAPVSTLRELAEWVAKADLFLGNNSGPMHLANALGCPGVAVTGPSALGWDPYWHRERWTVLRHPSLYCAPCEKPARELAGCANMDNPMACLKYWSVEMVLTACRVRLGQPAAYTP